jgi:Coenzyme PQQ synthesis protein D (PqqD)
MTAADHVTIPSNVVLRAFVQETVLMDVNTSRYFSLDRIGGAMLDELLGRATIRDAALELSRAGWGEPTHVEQELLELCGELEPLGLLHLESAA